MSGVVENGGGVLYGGPGVLTCLTCEHFPGNGWARKRDWWINQKENGVQKPKSATRKFMLKKGLGDPKSATQGTPVNHIHWESDAFLDASMKWHSCWSISEDWGDEPPIDWSLEIAPIKRRAKTLDRKIAFFFILKMSHATKGARRGQRRN